MNWYSIYQFGKDASRSRPPMPKECRVDDNRVKFALTQFGSYGMSKAMQRIFVLRRVLQQTERLVEGRPAQRLQIPDRMQKQNLHEIKTFAVVHRWPIRGRVYSSGALLFEMSHARTSDLR